jgi:hypothetical protein
LYVHRQARFSDPDGKHLSPAGEYNLRLGIMKECSPDMVATYQASMALQYFQYPTYALPFCETGFRVERTQK